MIACCWHVKLFSLDVDFVVLQDADGYCLAEVRCSVAEYEAGGDPQSIDWGNRFHTREQLSVRHRIAHGILKMWSYYSMVPFTCNASVMDAL